MATPESLQIGRDRVTQIFRYLQALDQLRNPAKRQVREQVWNLWLRDLPQHPAINRPDTHAATESEGLDDSAVLETTGESDAEREANPRPGYVLKVRRPELSSPPSPPADISAWLLAGWDDPAKAIEVNAEHEIEAPTQQLAAEQSSTAPPILERFEDSDSRRRLFEEWRAARDSWATLEKPVRDAMQVYERFYDLHARIMRESERLELVLGDGILNWRRSDGGIHHPLLLQRLQLTFDANHQEFTVAEADYPVEFYSALFRGMTDVNGQVIGKFRDEAGEGSYHPLDQEETDGFLKRLVVRLAASGEFVGAESMISEADHPRVGRDAVLFLRTRTLGFATALENILIDLPQREDVPNSLMGVVGMESPPAAIAEQSATLFMDGNEDENVLLSKPANPEQLAIAQRLDKHGSVLVQGPPGTGKTHTIANLVGHLLAQGKTVLVTSHTTKALRVLREKVVPPLQPLCVSVLENDSESRQQLESSINAIVERLSSSDAGQLESEAMTLNSQRLRLIQELHTKRERLFQMRASEYRDIVLCGTSVAPAEAAREIAAGQGIHDWVPGPIPTDAPLPLSQSELVDLYQTNIAISPSDEQELGASPPPVTQVLTPEAFERLVQAESSLQSEDRLTGVDLWNAGAAQQTPESLIALAEKLNPAIEPLQDEKPWRLSTIAAGHAGDLEQETWNSLIHLIEALRAQALQSKEALLNHGPVLAPDMTAEEQEPLLAQIASHLEGGGNLGGLTLVTRRSWKKLIEGARVGSAKPCRSEHFKALHALAQLQIARANLHARWERQMTSLGAPSAAELGNEPEVSCAQYIPLLTSGLNWYSQAWEPIERELTACGLDWAKVLNQMPPILGTHGDLIRLRNAVQQQLPSLLMAQANRLRWQHVQTTAHELERRIAAVSDSSDQQNTSNGGSSVATLLRTATTNRAPVLYRQAYGRLVELTERRAVLSKREALLQKLAAKAPEWAAAVQKRHAPHDGATVPGDASLAWRWRQLQGELERRDKDSLPNLQKDIEHVIKEMRETTAELIDRRAWAAQVRRTTPAQRKALIGWVQTVRKIGKGTGKRVPQLQADARRLMNECRGAVPVWTMPLNRVVENFDPRTTRFDVVIIDEASQSDVMGLIAFYLGQQIVVVGDDEQVSPDAVGQKTDEVQHLIDEHLAGIPNANLYDGQFSVYDVAMSSFGGTICLREHFRCVPDIIRFSNHLSYSGAIKPLRDASSVILKPHVISYRVEAAQAENKINEAEAKTLASLLIAATEQPEYDGATFGVISMVGLPQAERIDFLLRSYMEPTEYERRQIVCGNAPHFQGDEREVMFISLVDPPKDGPLMMQERPQYRKRLNVAASRARDQMWVVHSLQPEIDLKPGDLRRRFLEYAQDPEALERLFEREEAHVESEFERQVLRRLLGAGFRVVPQWKVGAYRIDLVVKGTNRRLAVECDGERYHGLDKLPDDMARQAILERLGWTFARIRGSDFFRDPDSAMDRVFQRLDDLGIERLGAVDTDSSTTEFQASELRDRVVHRAAELRHEWETEAIYPPKQNAPKPASSRWGNRRAAGSKTETAGQSVSSEPATGHVTMPTITTGLALKGASPQVVDGLPDARRDLEGSSEKTISFSGRDVVRGTTQPVHDEYTNASESAVTDAPAPVPLVSTSPPALSSSHVDKMMDDFDNHMCEAVVACVPEKGIIDRDDLIRAVAQRLELTLNFERFGALVDEAVSAEAKKGRLGTFSTRVWRIPADL